MLLFFFFFTICVCVCGGGGLGNAVLQLFSKKCLLFELILNVPVNSYGHARTLLPFLWDFYPKLRLCDIQKTSNITIQLSQ